MNCGATTDLAVVFKQPEYPRRNKAGRFAGAQELVARANRGAVYAEEAHMASVLRVLHAAQPGPPGKKVSGLAAHALRDVVGPAIPDDRRVSHFDVALHAFRTRLSARRASMFCFLRRS